MTRLYTLVCGTCQVCVKRVRRVKIKFIGINTFEFMLKYSLREKIFYFGKVELGRAIKGK